MTRTVLVGIDDSEFSKEALDFYIKNLHLKDDKIVLVHVSEYSNLVQSPIALADPMVVKQLLDEEDIRVKHLVHKYADMLKTNHLGGQVKHLAGKSGECIIDAAKESGAELIVLGTRGLGKVRRTFLGSVSDYVLHHAHVPVLIGCHSRKSSHD